MYKQQEHSNTKSFGIELVHLSSTSVVNVLSIHRISQHGKECASTYFQINDAGQSFMEETHSKTHRRINSRRDGIFTLYSGQFPCIWFFCDT